MRRADSGGGSVCLPLATFPKGNPDAEGWAAQMAARSALRRKQFGHHCGECLIFGAAKRNSPLLRFTSGKRAETPDLQGGA
jgi:hypothetical protein